MTARRKPARKAHRKAADQWAALPPRIRRELHEYLRDEIAWWTTTPASDNELARDITRGLRLAERVLREAAKGTR